MASSRKARLRSYRVESERSERCAR